MSFNSCCIAKPYSALRYLLNALNQLESRSVTENLVINGNFKNVVNQRGKISYTGIKGYLNGYGVDRWYSSNDGAIVTPDPSGLIVDTTGATGNTLLNQRMEIPRDGSYTLVVKTSQDIFIKQYSIAMGVIVTGKEDRETLIKAQCVVSNGLFLVQMIIPAGKTVTIEYCALYTGPFDYEDFPAYSPRPYVVELMDCMRYYQVGASSTVNALDLRPPMVKTPSVVTLEDGKYGYNGEL